MTSGTDVDSYEHKGLHYPFGRREPGPGELFDVAPDLHWARFPVPGPLRHVNVWILDEADGSVSVIDTGFDTAPIRAMWDALFAGPLAGKRVRRVLVTHFHPDHLGLAGYLCGRDGAPLLMTRTEWLMGRWLRADTADAPPAEALVYWRLAGWSEEQIAAEAAKGWGRFASAVAPFPSSFERLQGCDNLALGGRNWRVVISAGHSPEHASLVDEAGGLYIAGDAVLPRISPNVSLTLMEPEGDPLGDWLRSLDRLLDLPDDLLVLPSHGDPFMGLHARATAIRDAHRERLDALHERLLEPRRAVDCFSVLFGRAIDDSSRGLATGEALAHLLRLEREGRASRVMRDGVAWFMTT